MGNKIYAKFDANGFVSGFWQTAAFSGTIPVEAVEITQEQFNELFEFQGLRKWINGQVVEFVPVPVTVIPDRVSSRQFKMQLIISGIDAPVSAWVAAQTPLIRAAYDASSTFVRDDPMLQQGFAGLGFTTAQIDAFFTAASLL